MARTKVDPAALSGAALGQWYRRAPAEIEEERRREEAERYDAARLRMLPFFEQNHYSRRFHCGWPARAEGAESVAARVKMFAERAGEIEPIYGEVRPILAARAFRPTDPGPVRGMSVQELGAIIDKRCRFDPPRWPAPVSHGGYDAVYGNERIMLDPLNFSFSVRAGAYGRFRNGVEGGPNKDALVWRSRERGVALLLAYVDAWDADWAIAVGYVPSSDGESRWPPWLTWERHGARSDAFRKDIDQAGPPDEIRSERGGELQIWA